MPTLQIGSATKFFWLIYPQRNSVRGRNGHLAFLSGAAPHGTHLDFTLKFDFLHFFGIFKNYEKTTENLAMGHYIL